MTVGELLGAGGFGAVWNATDASGAPLALKVSHSTHTRSRELVKREATVMSRIGPPFVPMLHSSGLLDDGRPYLVMELLRGRTMADELEQASCAPPLAVVRALGDTLLRSVAAVHEQSFVHRDLKPENVFLVGGGGEALVAKLMDFGLSRAANALVTDSGVPERGAGTPEYIPPEQIASGNSDPRSDVYSLGVMLFELTTLHLPFSGEQRELEYAHLSNRPPRPSRFAPVPEPLEELILRCLAKDPAHRFADAGALHAAFVQVVSQLPEDARAPASEAGTPVPRLATTLAPGPVPVVRGSERQKVVLVFASGLRAAATLLQGALEPFGGLLTHAEPGKAACAFTHRAGDNPGQRALAAAEALIARGLVERLIIDVGTVASKARASGPPRLWSPMWTEAGRYPAGDDPIGIRLTAAACTLLPNLPFDPVPGRPGQFVRAASGVDDLPTAVGGERAIPLVGRDQPLRALIDEAHLAVNEWRPRVASVLADPGMGKSRLAFELVRALREKLPGAEVLELRSREPLGSNTDETFAELLRRTLTLPAARPADGGRELLGERLGEVANETYAGVALLLQWIEESDPLITKLRSAPGVLRAQMARAGFEALQRLAQKRPVLIVLDDVHWAEDALLDALEQATASELPLWICALGRPIFADNRKKWGQRATHLHVERLEGLDPEDAALLTRELLKPATNVPESVITQLVNRAQAVPLLLIDLVRGLRGLGLVRNETGGVAYVATEVLDRLPDSPLVEWIANRELDQLSADLAAHARLVSLLSPDISGEEVRGILGSLGPEIGGAFPMDAQVAMDRLKRAQLLVQHRTGRFSFRNAILRETVSKSLAGAQTAEIHRAALEYYRKARLPQSIRLPRLAYHAAQAGDRYLASTIYLHLADTARERHNYLEADVLFTYALAQLDESKHRRLNALQGRGIMRYRLGRSEGALEDLALAENLASQIGDNATLVDVLLDESMALDWAFEWHKSRELALRARELSRGLDTPVLEARVLLAVSRSLHRFNQDEAAVIMLQQTARLAEQLGDEGYEVQVTISLLLGLLLPFVGGSLDEAEAQLDRVSRLCESRGDELHQGALWNNRSCLFIARNDRERFVDANSRVLAFARRMGNAHLERNANLNRAYFLYWRAEFSEAEPCARRTIEIDARHFRQGGFRPDGAVLLARILWGQGDSAGAANLIDEIRNQQAAVRAEGKNDLLLLPNDEMLLDMIEMVINKGDASGWEPLVARARTVAAGQELIEVLEVAGLAASARGDQDGARRWWREALEAGERIANVMGDRIKRRLERTI